ncbi:MAG: glutamate mutase L [Candidatus Neomarinimicrobiota bacterium]|nr:glutamate mutase L [Candidatus Neomarinimicrobiota bacterium]|tara:strand:- start:750 stop:2564 length:1815 start_codon:yes stop_codon:yes gene_type:complete
MSGSFKLDKINVILATDCGSTTTKAILIQKIDGIYRLTHRGEAPTTVEAPFEDVTRGVLNAIIEIEELSGIKILNKDKILSPSKEKQGIDIFISTSSAGGGLQMMVSGVVKGMSGESAQRAALGAGAIVMDVLASNDGRLYHEKVKRIRQLRPDMILLSGGIDGGTINHVVELSEVLQAANPKPRLGINYKLPVIYAGNKSATKMIKKRLDKSTDLICVDNIRPTLEEENLKPSRDKIHDLFMEHVMAQAPGYKKLMSWTNVPIMPTPGAVGEIIKKIASQNKTSVLGVDIGGATTDVFSVFKDKFNRTVSANLGMSYSICNVLAETGIENVARWVPFQLNEMELTNRIANKMIRPTTIPQTLKSLKIEQAIAREALSLSFKQHKEFAVNLKGVQKERTISDTFDQSNSGKTLVNMIELDLLVGSGGVLSHAPRRSQSARMLIDSFLPEGLTKLAVDSIFMMPQLGVLSTIHKQAAIEVFEKDCLIYLGSCVAPVGIPKDENMVLQYTINIDGAVKSGKLKKGELILIDADLGYYDAEFIPGRNLDIGAGINVSIQTKIQGGVVGIFLDGRGRQPFNLPKNDNKRINSLLKWSSISKEYPGEIS